MDVWGPARVRGQGHERYFQLVVDDYSRYTTVFPLRSKGEVTEVLIDWIRGTRRQLSESFGSDLPVLRLHSDRSGEFSSDLLRAFCRAEGICQTFTLPASPQQNGIAERRIGMVMDAARTSMIHAAAPHFLWPFAVQYAAHQINLQPRVSLSETTPTLRWMGKVGDASMFRVWGSRAFVHDAFANKLSSRAVPCVFLGFPPDAPGWQFYHPTSRRVLSSQDVTFEESGPAPSGVSLVDPVELVEVAVDSGAARGAKPVGAGTGGAEPGVAEPGGVETGGAEPGGAESGGAEPERAESGGPPSFPSRREPLSPQRLREWYARRCSRAAGATRPAAGGASGAGAAGGAAGAGAAGAAGPGCASAGVTDAVGGPAGVGAAGAGVAGPGGARSGGTGAAGAGGAAGVGDVATGGAAGAGAAGAAGPGGASAGGTGPVRVPTGVGAAGAGGAAEVGAVATGGAAGDGAVGGAGARGATGVATGDPGAKGTGAVSSVLGLPPSTGPTPLLLSPPPVQSQSELQPASPLRGPSPCSGPTRGLTERREPESRLASPESRPKSSESRPESPFCAVRTGRHVPRPPLVHGTHSMTLRPSTAPQRVPLPSPHASSLPALADPESDSLRVA
ncbi:unnamed protein product, partial [Closterium sp. NIES-54]